MSDSRISGLYKLSVFERIVELEKLGWLSSDAARDLQAGRQVISAIAADRVIENVVGVFGLPLAIAPNFIVNDRYCIVPLVVEEPSIVAALSSAAALARNTGGFSAKLDESLLIGQIHVVGVSDIEAAIAALNDASRELLAIADAVHPRLKARGGGVRGIEFRELLTQDGTAVVAVHVLVDTCVWSAALRRRQVAVKSVEVRELRALIAAGSAVMMGPVRQELLSGVSSRAQYDRLRDHLRAFPDLVLETADFERAAELRDEVIRLEAFELKGC